MFGKSDMLGNGICLEMLYVWEKLYALVLFGNARPLI